MSYRNKTYVIFSGDDDIWAYRLMKAWNSSKHITFNFYDAHDLKPLTDRASDETVRARLRERFSNAKQAIVLIGYSTKNLYKFVRWEIEIALDLDLPIIAVNLNRMRVYDEDLCPPILRDKYVVHVSYNARIIKYALDNFPMQYNSEGRPPGGNWQYVEAVYKKVGLMGQLRSRRLAFIIYINEAGEFRWCMMDQDNHMLAESGVSFRNARECRKAINELKRQFSQATIEDTTYSPPALLAARPNPSFPR